MSTPIHRNLAKLSDRQLLELSANRAMRAVVIAKRSEKSVERALRPIARGRIERNAPALIAATLVAMLVAYLAINTTARAAPEPAPTHEHGR